jgi:predicted LPLAT superfamily acyltransferase
MMKHSVAEGLFVAAARRLRRRWPALWLARTLPARRVEPLRCRFEALLGEPSGAARTLAFDWFFYKQLEVSSWADVDRPSGVLRDRDRVGAYLHDCPRGVVVATIHMGDYLEALRQLRLVAPAGRPIYVLRRGAATDVERRAFAHVAGAAALTVLRSGDSLAAPVRALRRGALLVTLFDLPGRYGRTVPVTFFGRPARFVCGPAELAVLGRADVLPLFCHYDADLRPVAEAAPVIAADGHAHMADALTQQLCGLAERRICAHPSQWAHWSLLDELLVASA